MLSSVTFAIIATVALSGTNIAASDAQCTAVSAQLSVNLSTNASGHWATTLRLSREWPVSGRPGALQLQVQPATSRCCGVRSDALSVTLRGPPPPAGPGFEEVPGIGYYKVHEETVSWEQAKTACEAEDAHLLILNSEAEAAGVQQLIKRHPSIKDWVHAGFNDKQREGNYVTVFGQPLSSTGYLKWNPNQPDNGGNNENCGSIHTAIMGLNDSPCTSSQPFVCEQIPG